MSDHGWALMPRPDTKIVMEREKLELWVSALTSGKYRQGTGVLGRELVTGRKEHCCLGVLCELAVEAGVIPPPTQSEATANSRSRLEYGAEKNTLTLPREVMAWAGLDPMINPSVRVGEGNLLIPLENLNDQHTPFAEIAELIRASAI